MRNVVTTEAKIDASKLLNKERSIKVVLDLGVEEDAVGDCKENGIHIEADTAIETFYCHKIWYDNKPFTASV